MFEQVSRVVLLLISWKEKVGEIKSNGPEERHHLLIIAFQLRSIAVGLQSLSRLIVFLPLQALQKLGDRTLHDALTERDVKVSQNSSLQRSAVLDKIKRVVIVAYMLFLFDGKVRLCWSIRKLSGPVAHREIERASILRLFPWRV